MSLHGIKLNKMLATYSQPALLNFMKFETIIPYPINFNSDFI